MGFGCFRVPVSSADTQYHDKSRIRLRMVYSFFSAVYGQLFSSKCLKLFSCLSPPPHPPPPKNKHETLVLKREERAEMQYKSERERKNEKKLHKLQSFFFSSSSMWWIRNVWESQYTGLTIPMLIAQEGMEKAAESRLYLCYLSFHLLISTKATVINIHRLKIPTQKPRIRQVRR